VRLERQAGIENVARLEAVYLGATEVLVAADVVMDPDLGLEDATLALAGARAQLREEVPVIARLYLTPVPHDDPVGESLRTRSPRRA
jgi:divalent metal cation (Fe/Co/Zn/Cd) transporter